MHPHQLYRLKFNLKLVVHLYVKVCICMLKYIRFKVKKNCTITRENFLSTTKCNPHHVPKISLEKFCEKLIEYALHE